MLDSHSYSDSEESGHLMLSNDSVHNDDSASPTAQLRFSGGSDFQSSVALVQNTPVGRLTARREVLDRLGASEYVLSVLGSRYKLPFISLPDKIIFCNNLSARNETEFVSDAIDMLQALGCILEVGEPPFIVDPLTVSSRNDKKRLILDLRHVNPQLGHCRFKCEDFNTMREVLSGGAFLYAFEIKSAYHHVPVHPHFHTYLGFSWGSSSGQRYYHFVVLSFGLSTGPFVFTKIVKAVVSKWRSECKLVGMYLDDRLDGAASEPLAKRHANEVHSLLIDLGFLISEEKCHWESSKHAQWLGHDIDMSLAR